MNPNFVDLLKCPFCSAHELVAYSFEDDSSQNILNGVLWCKNCKSWYSIEDGLLELLSGELVYQMDRQAFWDKYQKNLTQLGLTLEPNPLTSYNQTLQHLQQSHFDWYASNDSQTYSAYKLQPFWKSVDKITFDAWRREIIPGKKLLDVGCAEGRSTFEFLDQDIDVIGFDISRQLVRQAIRRYKNGKYKARALFFVADATTFPFIDSILDYVLVYGVLHHLPDPQKTCKEINRVLRPGGVYFGSENNKSVFRRIFDFLQKVFPLWYEEAGPEAMLSLKAFQTYFKDTTMVISYRTCVFLPPHIVNIIPEKFGFHLMRIVDFGCKKLPFLKDNGGLVVIRAQKS
jgi:ubiquinone/menaquinone biosynthesis C-methylase UbiE/uncharacterized protein YbaR (Trm112 family)